MKLDSLVIAHQPWRGEYVPGPCITNTVISVEGRHDPAIIHRARAVVDAVTALALGDLLATRYGTDFLAGGKTL